LSLRVTDKGGDAFSVCMNTVAVVRTTVNIQFGAQRKVAFGPADVRSSHQCAHRQVFVMEIDNLSFNMGFPEHVRNRVQARGRVEISDSEAVVLEGTKPAYVLLTVFIMLATVAGYHQGLTYITLCSWIGAVVEAVLARGTPKDTAVRIATAFVAMVMGFVLEMALMLSTMDA
jgi:hypothetical protein